ncbi:uncharacterized protein A4U43_C07F14500 [Asparagus officinalis]|uniref:SWIM-type domain-containing protein n=1 Tax=Asparagus officinalis TaxID=4686 RepID=A0A5P1EDV9_ASPOF|nr:uncharacterized protein LOC109847097 [Asparagus officinalis]ONK63377.1 uncharacterized protein A4U43_C07F14500 [Asparagus officinalis]
MFYRRDIGTLCFGEWIVEKEAKMGELYIVECRGYDRYGGDEEGFDLNEELKKINSVGLIRAVGDYQPEAAHRFCVRHLYQNFKESFKGKYLKDQLWGAAMATMKADFDSYMDAIKAHNSEAREWLDARPAHQWSRHAFGLEPSCDILLNNISECFNSCIREAREKPIITLLESIRRYLMQRLEKKRNEPAFRRNFKLMPKIQKKIEVAKDGQRYCKAIPSGVGEMEVHCNGDQFTVDINTKKCSCYKWQVSGIPCCHAVAVIYAIRANPEDFVAEWFTKEKYIHAYTPVLHPIRGMRHWPRSKLQPLLPPMTEKSKDKENNKKRRKDPEEAIAKGSKLSRKGYTVTCKVCKVVGHNQRTCPLKKNDRTGAMAGAYENASNEVFMGFNVPIGPEDEQCVTQAEQPPSNPIISRGRAGKLIWSRIPRI